jgi:hypothetical protein
VVLGLPFCRLLARGPNEQVIWSVNIPFWKPFVQGRDPAAHGPTYLRGGLWDWQHGNGGTTVSLRDSGRGGGWCDAGNNQVRVFVLSAAMTDNRRSGRW